MKIVICQGEPIGGSPSREALLNYWNEQLKPLKKENEIIFRGGFNYEKMDEIVKDADALVGTYIKDDYYNEEFFKKYPKLKYIATYAHGYGRFDKAAARKYGVIITNTIYGDVTIAQFAMALLLDICHNVRLQDQHYKEAMDNHITVARGSNVRVKTKQIELYEKTIGIIGLGSIGIWTARMAAGFGMKVISHNRSKKTGAEYDFVEQVSMEELLERSDVISLHCPLTDETKQMINKESISKMKDGVILVNTARGDLINEADLVEALNSGKIYAAGLDVVANEPISERCALMYCKNAVITPHIAWAPEEATYRTVRVATLNLQNWLQGTPTSVIS
ncbi:glycerate dehydrogenase [Kineothrix alysoides]|uniref:Glycerate dehydrogenase n=1 Tax=Kineothrix alysoides TaxID=1469948 RepID=A0A4R1R5W3_9FIRM|nr:NAD(P)-dependent oxidoreductase [Kineothrix alysoides]TCL60915.1 glycerate dehydrogenase [Kineothrix alysoides]